MSGRPNAPIIIKRKKVIAGGGHHGGAWKVAYADFVTAMMAFFLLMWLLGATTEKQRKGIADFFNPTIPVNRISGGGDGAFGGDSVFSEQTLASSGTGAAAYQPTEQNQASGSIGGAEPGISDEAHSDQEADEADLEEIEARFSGLGGESMVTELLQRHIVSRISDEGLIVEIFDIEDEPLFSPGTADPTRNLEELLSVVVDAFGLASNPVAVHAHVAALPMVVANRTPWQNSLDRAEAVRRLLETGGLRADRIARVTGFGDRKPALKDSTAIENNRIELILLRDRL